MAKWDHRKAEALAALDANGGNVNRTAKQLGIPESTLRGWCKVLTEAEALPLAEQSREIREFREVREEKKEALADRLETIAHKLVEAIEGKIPDATLQQVATSLGITVDKMQLLRDKPTAINKEQGLTDDERAARITDLLERGRNRSGAALPHGGGTGGAGVPARPVAN